MGAKGILSIVAVAVGVAALIPAAQAASAGRVAVVVTPAFDPARYAGRGAVGLLVPGTGTTVTREGALAALVRGEVRNPLIGGVPGGPPLIPLSRSPGPVTIYVSLPPPGRSSNVRRYPVAVVGGGYSGVLTSTSTRIDGLVSVADVAPTVLALERGASPPIGSHADPDAVENLRALDTQLREIRGLRPWATVVLVFGTLLLLPTGAALLAPVAALSASLALSAAGATNAAVVLGVLAAATVLVPPVLIRVAPWAIVVFLAVCLVVLAASPETNALSVIGPHPDGGGRYFGLTNEVETLLLAPVLVAAAELGVLPVGVLAILLVGWSRAGADGGGVVVFAAALTVLELRARRIALTPLRLALACAVSVAAIAAIVGLDLLLGGSDHVTRAVRGGPGSLLGDWGHRLHVSWASAVSSWHSILFCAVFLLVLAGFALRRPRSPAVDALLVGIAVSLLVNDTPVDAIAFGALGCGTVIAWERMRRPGGGPLSKLAAVRRPAILSLFLLGLVGLAAGCGGAKTVSPTAETVIGSVPTQEELPPGDAAAGKAVFESNGCGGCHTFKPSGTNASVGPDLDKLPELAKKADKGTEAEFTLESIKDPSAYVESGFADVMPKDYGTSLTGKQLADLVAFLVAK